MVLLKTGIEVEVEVVAIRVSMVVIEAHGKQEEERREKGEKKISNIPGDALFILHTAVDEQTQLQGPNRRHV